MISLITQYFARAETKFRRKPEQLSNLPPLNFLLAQKCFSWDAVLYLIVRLNSEF